jgi:DNA invertase Pin-like site-specific DNA recombinase
MLAVFAQFETDVRRERQAEGIGRIIADPKLRRQKYTGGKQRIDRRKVLGQSAEGHGPAAIAKALGISRMSVYRVLQTTDPA